MAERRLSDFELKAQLNRLYAAEHGEPPPKGYWMGDAEYLAEVRTAAAKRVEQKREKYLNEKEKWDAHFAELKAREEAKKNK